MSPGVAILCISLHILSTIWWLVNDISTRTVDKRRRIPTPMRPILFLNSRFYDAPFKLPLWHLISERWRVWSTVADFCTVDTSFVLALLGWLLALTYREVKEIFVYFFYNGSNGHPSITAWCGGVLLAWSRCNLPPVRRCHLQPVGCFQVRPNFNILPYCSIKMQKIIMLILKMNLFTL